MASCNSLPGNGPLSSDIAEQSQQSVAQSKIASNVVFDIVDIDANSSRLIASYDSRLLQQRFGIGGGVKKPVIGVGDHLKVRVEFYSNDGQNFVVTAGLEQGDSIIAEGAGFVTDGIEVTEKKVKKGGKQS